MSDKSQIEWTDATWNPAIGCTKKSAGCKFCYFMVQHDRRHKAWPDAPQQYHLPSTEIQLFASRLDQPMRWRKPRRIFVNSLSDLFHAEIPRDFIDQVFAVMLACPRHTFQILTKRPERMAEYTNDPELWSRVLKYQPMIEPPQKSFPSWIHLGASAEDQKSADEMIPHLQRANASVRFVSVEPMLGPVDLLIAAFNGSSFSAMDGIHWVICGGESGPGARPMHPSWVRNLRDQCKRSAVPFFFKQWGEWITEYPGMPKPKEEVVLWPDGRIMRPEEFVEYAVQMGGRKSEWQVRVMGRIGKKKTGRIVDCREHNEMPE